MATLPLDRLHPHPENANRMPRELFAKLIAHIRESGTYPPIIVRPHPTGKACYQIIDGHHRAEALRELDCDHANCDVWNVDDAQTTMLLLTLNRLHGEDDPGKRGKLLATLAKQTDVDSLAKLLPDDASRIRKLLELNQPPKPPAEPIEPGEMPQAVTFFLNESQRHSLLARLKAIDADRSRALVKVLELDT